ncbi:MAG: YggT family protein [Chloroflexi bacterium]|nr:YggT family protein [Chloroflexota bacterium]
MKYLVTFVSFLFQALNIAILARVLISWVPSLAQSRVGELIYEITEPILGPIRRLLPNIGGFDFSPLIAMVLLQALARLLTRALGA